MSAPGEEEERRGFIDSPRWMDGDTAMIAAPGFMIAGLSLAIGAAVSLAWVATGRSSMSALWATALLLVLSIVCFFGYRAAARRMTRDDRPRGVDPARHFRVKLLATGGWLSRYLWPTVDAHLTLTDEEFRILYRRPRNDLWLAAMGLFAVAYIPRVFGFAQFLSWIPVWVPMAGYLLLLGLHMRSQGNRYDRRYPWSRVTSVAAAVEKFHVKVDDEEVPQGFLIDVGAKDRKSVAELLAARALFHDEAAAAMRTT